MPPTLAFDVYGTLIDTHGLVPLLGEMVGEEVAPALSRIWREKQLEYSFRRALARDYVTFATCTRQALDYACATLGVKLAPTERDSLLERYRTLPAFPEVPGALARLQDSGARLYAFSNGTRKAVEQLLCAAGIRDAFLDVVSVDAVSSFKPDPAVYAHFLAQAGARADQTWLVSGNPFDVLGAEHAGWHTVWVRRDAVQIFDPWERQPEQVVSDLDGLARLATRWD